MHTKSPLFNPVLIAGCVIVMTGFAIRGSYGMFQIPIATEFGWPRADFSMAIANQNLAWGFGQAIFGAISISIIVLANICGTLMAGWIATIPLTAGLVAHLYGARHTGTL